MKRIYLLIINFLVLVGFAQKNKNLKNSLSKEPFKTDVLGKYNDSIANKNYGISILVKSKNKIFQDNIGYSSKDVKLSNNSIFSIGSATKTFTAVLILQEVENGKLSLNDTIGNFLPFNKNVNSGISIKSLLNHTSGIGELVIEELNNDASNDAFNVFNHNYLYNSIPVPIGKPNEKYYYSNTNYILLGYILEIINDKSYSDLVRERIFQPLGMLNSYPYRSKKIENVVHPFVQGFDLFNYTNFYYSKNLAFSSSGISTSLEDFSKFVDALFIRKSLLKIETIKLMTDFKDGIGLGINAYNIDNEIYFGMKGDNLSYPFSYYFNLNNENIFVITGNQFGFSYQNSIEKEVFKYLKNLK